MRWHTLVMDTGPNIEVRTRRSQWRDVAFALRTVETDLNACVEFLKEVVMPPKTVMHSIEPALERAMVD